MSDQETHQIATSYLASEIDLVIWQQAKEWVEGFLVLDPDLKIADSYVSFLELHTNRSPEERLAFYKARLNAARREQRKCHWATTQSKNLRKRRQADVLRLPLSITSQISR